MAHIKMKTFTISLILYIFLIYISPAHAVNFLAGGRDSFSDVLPEETRTILPSTKEAVNKNKVIPTKNIQPTQQNCPYNNWLISIFSMLISGFVGAFIALWLDRFNDPDLKIIVAERGHDDKVFPQNYTVPGRWKFFRIIVVNNSLPWYCQWLFHRETAEQLHGKITFKQIGKSMKGRWSFSFELPFASNPGDQMRLANFPEPENIFPGDETIMDIFAKCEHDIEAYGWNNEAYLNNWRTQNYKLLPGDYDIEVTIAGLNTKKTVQLKAHIANTIDNTYLENT